MDKVALVTGADRGLGRALSQNLLEAGWTVIAGRYMSWPELDTLAEEYGSRLILLTMDVGSDDSVNEAARQASNAVPHIDLVISNAAIHRSLEIWSITDQLDFNAVMDEFNVNSLGALRVSKAFLPLLARGDLKRLCFISSEAGSIGASERTGWFGYCMSKAALNMAVKNLSNDLSPKGFSFRLYHPGWLRTYMSGEKNMEAHMEPEEGAAIALRYFLSEARNEELALHCFDGQDMPW